MNGDRNLFSAYSVPDNVVSNVDSGLVVNRLFCSRETEIPKIYHVRYGEREGETDRYRDRETQKDRDTEILRESERQRGTER